MDKWHGMTMEDIQALEDQTKLERAKVSGIKLKSTD